jgi:hypothetical protein
MNIQHRTPLSRKQENIWAFQRLLQLSRDKGYRGKPLDDRTTPGLQHCIATWFNLNGYECDADGNRITVQFKDGPFVIVVAGTHRSHEDYPVNEYVADFEMRVYSLFRFENWFDNLT